LETKKIEKGLNYLIWKLDEKAASLNTRQNPGAKGIPVLPGNYTIVLRSGNHKDTTQVKVIADPRFDMDPEVDGALYTFRKDVDRQVEVMSKTLKDIDDKLAVVKKIEKLQEEKEDKQDEAFMKAVQKMKGQLKELRSKGQIPRPERQVGAWQSFETSPYTELRDVLRLARAQTSIPSNQHQEMLQRATQSIATFTEQVDNFMKKQWQPFEKSIKNSAMKAVLD